MEEAKVASKISCIQPIRGLRTTFGTSRHMKIISHEIKKYRSIYISTKNQKHWLIEKFIWPWDICEGFILKAMAKTKAVWFYNKTITRSVYAKSLGNIWQFFTKGYMCWSLLCNFTLSFVVLKSVLLLN